MVLTTFSPFLISKLTVPSDVVEYNIYLKLFYLISSIFVIALTPMWSMFTKAYAENDINWIKRIYKKFIILASIATGLEFALILILQPILNVWLNDNSITVNYSYAIVFAILGCLYIWNGLFSSLSNGINNLKIQRLCFLLGVIIFVPLSYLFVHLTESWIGVVIANCISLSLYSIVQPFYIKRIFYKQEKNVLVK
jgi:O-antigen/teichoic acid export membrane protein